LTCKLVESSI